MKMDEESMVEDNLTAWMTCLRRQLHREPERSGEERQTRAKLVAALRKLGLMAQTYEMHYGVSAVIEGAQDGPTVALRADMDGLSVTEETGLPYASAQAGLMHACGHDMHMAGLLGAAALLQRRRDKLRGRVKLLFQPAEELAPQGGARFFLRAGFLTDVRAIFGLHIWPELATGEIGVKDGPMMAASDRFAAKLFGKGAHAGQPHRGVDAIVAGMNALQEFQQIVSRQVDPLSAAVLSVGCVRGGERYNVVAREFAMEGTVRTLDNTARTRIEVAMEQALAGVAQAGGATYALEYQRGYPALCNWRGAVEIVRRAARGLAARDVRPAMASEDFGFYLEEIPGAFFWIGCRAAGQSAQSLHSAQFAPDEAALSLAARLLCDCACEALEFLNDGGVFAR